MISFLHKMETRHLHGADMKLLVHILRDVPQPTEERYEHKEAYYQKFTKKDIQELPRRLRSSNLSFGSGNLCSLHKGLNAHLINDIWAWLKHEFEGAVGEFLYPLIMFAFLTTEQEWSVRQMEPVLEMWRQDFKLEASPPPGREPIQCAGKWYYQKDQCPACMIARIGSDKNVLFALFAGIVGRLSSKRAVNGSAEDEVPCYMKSGSKRVRFVKYWIRTMEDGEPTVTKAGDLGLLLRRLTLEWKHGQHNLSGTTVSDTSANSATEAKKVRLIHVDTKIGPTPRPHGVEPLSPAEKLGFNLPNRNPPNPQESSNSFSGPSSNPFSGSAAYNRFSSGTLSPSDSISEVVQRPAPLRIPHNPFAPNHTAELRQPSIMTPNTTPPWPEVQPPSPTPSTIISYTGGPSACDDYADLLNHPIYNIFKSEEEGVEKYRRLLATDNPFNTPNNGDRRDDLRIPERTSMYFAFWDRQFNGAQFDSVDEEPAKDEAEALAKERKSDELPKERESKASTRWSDFYE